MQRGKRPAKAFSLLRHRYARMLFLWTLGGAAWWQPAAADYEPFIARYALTTQGAKIGETDWSVKPAAAEGFVYESRTVATGIFGLVNRAVIVERSEWRIRDGRLQPLSYAYSRSGGDKERNVAVNFDWQNDQVENTAEGHSWRMPLPEGTLDKLSYVLVLMAELAGDRTEFSYRIADGGRLKTYQLRVEGEERIDTALGPMDTVVVRRLRNSEDRETLLWCARSLGFLPVMIEHRERDGTVLWRIESFERH